MADVSVSSVLEPPAVAEADAPEAMILALEGADREVIQGLLAAAAARLPASGARVSGVAGHLPEGGGHSEVLLRDLVSGATLPLHQDLGAGAASCSLDPSSLAAACGWVETAVAACQGMGVDGRPVVVILSKFGRQEAEGRGFTDAFHAAVAAELPVLTSVSPSVRGEWLAFVGDMARMAPPQLEAVEAWWASISAASATG